MKFNAFTLNINGALHRFTAPAIMGIVNVTPDSFYSSSRVSSDIEICKRAEEMIVAGASILDVGGYSSRPGAMNISEEEELKRLAKGISSIRRVAPDCLISVDTFRSAVAKAVVEDMGANIINDISGGTLDTGILPAIATLKVPYILMHMRGTPQDMQQYTDYGSEGVVCAVTRFFSERMDEAENLGITDIILDPGFGFSKTTEQNYELLAGLRHLEQSFDRPVLVGLSRKSMFYKPLGLSPHDVLPATITANTMAVLNGASIIRVHDVEAARQTLHTILLTYPQTSDTTL